MNSNKEFQFNTLHRIYSNPLFMGIWDMCTYSCSRCHCCSEMSVERYHIHPPNFNANCSSNPTTRDKRMTKFLTYFYCNLRLSIFQISALLHISSSLALRIIKYPSATSRDASVLARFAVDARATILLYSYGLQSLWGWMNGSIRVAGG